MAKTVKLEESEHYRLLYLGERQTRLRLQAQEFQKTLEKADTEFQEAIQNINVKYEIDPLVEVKLNMEEGLLIWPEEHEVEEE